MVHNFQKIYAPFKREGLKDRLVKFGLWQNSALEATQHLVWEWTEKIDGTSIGVKWDGERVSLVGHTDKSQIPQILKKWLEEKFCTPEAETVFESVFGETNITLYGEGLSKETNQNYGFPDGNFIIYDVYCDTSKQFWSREAVKDIADKFELTMPAVIMTDSIVGAVHTIQGDRMMSALDKTVKMEGVVGRPPVELVSNGQRLITKVKYHDFKTEEEM